MSSGVWWCKNTKINKGLFHLISKQDFVLAIGWNKSRSYEGNEEKS
jgi:hypothetical protein